MSWFFSRKQQKSSKERDDHDQSNASGCFSFMHRSSTSKGHNLETKADESTLVIDKRDALVNPPSPDISTVVSSNSSKAIELEKKATTIEIFKSQNPIDNELNNIIKGMMDKRLKSENDAATTANIISGSAGVLPISIRDSPTDPMKREMVVLLGLEFRDDVGFDVLVDFGGICENVETSRVCALRELAEETGLTYAYGDEDSKAQMLFDVGVTTKYHSYLLPVPYIPQHVIKERSDVQRLIVDTVEKAEYYWIKLEDLIKAVEVADEQHSKREKFDPKDIKIDIESKEFILYSEFGDLLCGENKNGLSLLCEIKEAFMSGPSNANVHEVHLSIDNGPLTNSSELPVKNEGNNDTVITITVNEITGEL